MALKYTNVSIEDLELGRKYLIHYHSNIYPPYITSKGIFIRYTQNPRNGSLDLEYEEFAYNVSFFLRKSKTFVICSDMDDFYEMSPQTPEIQCAMESRAVNKILQRIVGDDTFTYL